MIMLEKEFRFEAAHRLENHDGKCRRLHGHSWKMTVAVFGDELISQGPKQGMLMDYGDIKAVVDPIVEQYLDHYYLNETLLMSNPTSENIAIWLWNKLSSAFESYDRPLYEIRVEETCTARCTYWRP
jgi:6-pyruvoyltetrahydropterin/6-carboxytetrahydropterin synthase